MHDKSRKNAYKKLPWREQFKKYSYNNKKVQQWLVRRLRQLRLVHPNLDFVKARKHRSRIKHYSWLFFKPHNYLRNKRKSFFFLYSNDIRRKYHLSQIYPSNLKAKRFFYSPGLNKSLKKMSNLKKEITHFPVFLKTSYPFLIKNNAYSIFKNFKYLKYQSIVDNNSSYVDESNLSLFAGKLTRGLFFFSTAYKRKKALLYRLKGKMCKNSPKNLYIHQRIKRHFLGNFKKFYIETKPKSTFVPFYNKQKTSNKAIKRIRIAKLLFDSNTSPKSSEEKKFIKVVWKGFSKYKTRSFMSDTEFLNRISKSRLYFLGKKESVYPQKLKLQFKKQLISFDGKFKKIKMSKRKNYIDDCFFRMIDIHKLSNSGTSLYKVLKKTQYVRLNKSRNKRLRKRKCKKRVRKLRFILGYKRPKSINFSLPRHVEFNYKTFNGLHMGYSDNSSASYRIPFWLNMGKLATFLSY